jgi:hypothetical protein
MSNIFNYFRNKNVNNCMTTRPVLHGIPSIDTPCAIVEVVGGSEDTLTLVKELKLSGRVMLNHRHSKSDVFIGELITNGRIMLLMSLEGVMPVGHVEVESVKLAVYHYSQETLPVGFPAQPEGDSRLFTVTPLPSSAPYWECLAFDGDMQYNLLYDLISTCRLYTGKVDPRIISSHK